MSTILSLWNYCQVYMYMYFLFGLSDLDPIYLDHVKFM